ncbi:hypothetical protein THAOC_32960, partial [Thalassiosira oceanica]
HTTVRRLVPGVVGDSSLEVRNAPRCARAFGRLSAAVTQIVGDELRGSVCGTQVRGAAMNPENRGKTMIRWETMLVDMTTQAPTELHTPSNDENRTNLQLQELLVYSLAQPQLTPIHDPGMITLSLSLPR